MTGAEAAKIARIVVDQIDALEAERDSLRAQLVAMTAARDKACRLLEGTISELAELALEDETNPTMLDGHRLQLVELQKVGAPWAAEAEKT